MISVKWTIHRFFLSRNEFVSNFACLKAFSVKVWRRSIPLTVIWCSLASFEGQCDWIRRLLGEQIVTHNASVSWRCTVILTVFPELSGYLVLCCKQKVTSKGHAPLILSARTQTSVVFSFHSFIWKHFDVVHNKKRVVFYIFRFF